MCLADIYEKYAPTNTNGCTSVNLCGGHYWLVLIGMVRWKKLQNIFCMEWIMMFFGVNDTEEGIVVQEVSGAEGSMLPGKFHVKNPDFSNIAYDWLAAVLLIISGIFLSHMIFVSMVLANNW